MRLLDLAQEASGCTACRLAERRTNVVFGEGDPFSPLVLDGEGPGADEDATGRPFVGKAGKMLDRALAEAGVPKDTIEAVFAKNALRVLCRAGAGD